MKSRHESLENELDKSLVEVEAVEAGSRCEKFHKLSRENVNSSTLLRSGDFLDCNQKME